RIADVADPVIVAAQGEDRLARLDVPDPYGFVAAGRGDVLAVGREADAQHVTGVAAQLTDRTAAGAAPQADNAVTAGGGERLAVGADGDGEDAVAVAAQLPAGRRGGGVKVDGERTNEHGGAPRRRGGKAGHKGNSWQGGREKRRGKS